MTIETEQDWLDKVKKLRFTDQLKLAVAMAVLDCAKGKLTFDQRKDVVQAGLTLYGQIYAVDLIGNILDDKRYDRLGFPREERDTLKVAALALWSDETIDRLHSKMVHFLNMSEMVRDAKPPGDYHGD